MKQKDGSYNFNFKNWKDGCNMKQQPTGVESNKDQIMELDENFEIGKGGPDLNKFKYVFVVMELVESDMKKLLSSQP